MKSIQYFMSPLKLLPCDLSFEKGMIHKMNNLMDTYITFTEKKIKKYMKTLLSKQYDEQIINEYLKTYINARYYNIQNTDKPARAFYLRILEELEYKEDILMKKCEEESETLDEKQIKLNKNT